jgi:hypothetical protein
MTRGGMEKISAGLRIDLAHHSELPSRAELGNWLLPAAAEAKVEGAIVILQVQEVGVGKLVGMFVIARVSGLNGLRANWIDSRDEVVCYS